MGDGIYSKKMRDIFNEIQGSDPDTKIRRYLEVISLGMIRMVEELEDVSYGKNKK